MQKLFSSCFAELHIHHTSNDLSSLEHDTCIYKVTLILTLLPTCLLLFDIGEVSYKNNI